MSARFAYGDLWLDKKQLAEIYDTTQENISGKVLRRTMRGSNRAVTDTSVNTCSASARHGQNIFAKVQNKLYYAVHENTDAEIIYNSADSEKPFVGMTNFKSNYAVLPKYS